MDKGPDLIGLELSLAQDICKTSGYKIEIIFTRPYKVQPDGKPRVIRIHRVSRDKWVITVAFEKERKEVDKVAYKITEECLDACPIGAISEGDIYKIDPDKCESCGACADACPTGAIVEE